MNKIQNQIWALVSGRKIVLSHVPRDSNASGWDGSVPQLPPFVMSPCATSVYTRETNIVLNCLFFRDHSAGFLTLAGHLDFCGSREAATCLCRHCPPRTWDLYDSWTIYCGLDNHHWATLLGITAGGVCGLIVTNPSSRWVTWIQAVSKNIVMFSLHAMLQNSDISI